jgi:hypothetical protein
MYSVNLRPPQRAFRTFMEVEAEEELHISHIVLVVAVVEVMNY